MASISTTSGEEEACSKAFLFIVFSRHGPGNSGLPRASQAVQPEYAPLILSVSPCSYLLKDVNSSIPEAQRFILSLRRVEGRLGSIKQFCQAALLFGNILLVSLGKVQYDERTVKKANFLKYLTTGGLMPIYNFVTVSLCNVLIKGRCALCTA